VKYNSFYEKPTIVLSRATDARKALTASRLQKTTVLQSTLIAFYEQPARAEIKLLIRRYLSLCQNAL